MTRTYGTLRRVAGGWEIGAIEPHVAIRLKQLFPRIKKSDAPPHGFPDDAATAAGLDWFLVRYPLAMSGADRAALTAGRLRFLDDQAAMERVLQHDYAPPAFAGLRDGQVLRHYQAQAVALLERARGLLLGDDVGLGKTFTTAGACLLPGALPAVVVCHPHLAGQWCDVIERFTTLKAHAIKGTRPYALPPADVLVFRYTQLGGWSDFFAELKPGLAAFDEIQELRRGTESVKGGSAMRLARTARLRLGLSATPIYNYGTEIWRVMEFLRPEVLGAHEDFYREWCGWGGRVQDPAALGSYLREQYAFMRRTKRDVGQDMPKVNRIVDLVDQDGDALEAIEAQARALAVRTTVGEFTERGRASRELDLLVRQATGVGKARAVAAFARILIEAGEPIVLVGWHRDVYAIWLEALADHAPAMYTGSETPAAKARAVQRFLAGETPVLILSLRSGAGLDGLQHRCSTMVFGELDWSPGVHHQCVGRLDREGQAAPVTAIFLVSDDGSDPPMLEVLGLKASQAAHIVDPALGVQAVHSDYSHVQAIARRYLDRKGRVPSSLPVAAPAAERVEPRTADLFGGAA